MMPSLGAMDPETENLSMVCGATADILAHVLSGEKHHAVHCPGMCEFSGRYVSLAYVYS